MKRRIVQIIGSVGLLAVLASAGMVAAMAPRPTVFGEGPELHIRSGQISGYADDPSMTIRLAGRGFPAGKRVELYTLLLATDGYPGPPGFLHTTTRSDGSFLLPLTIRSLDQETRHFPSFGTFVRPIILAACVLPNTCALTMFVRRWQH